MIYHHHGVTRSIQISAFEFRFGLGQSIGQVQPLTVGTVAMQVIYDWPMLGLVYPAPYYISTDFAHDPQYGCGGIVNEVLTVDIDFLIGEELNIVISGGTAFIQVAEGLDWFKFPVAFGICGIFNGCSHRITFS